MKPPQIALLTIICVIGLSEFGPRAVEFFSHTRKVKVGEIWVSTLYGTIDFVSNSEHTIIQTTTRKVVAIDGSDVTYVIPNDTTKYIMDVDEFTFNGNGMKSYRQSSY